MSLLFDAAGPERARERRALKHEEEGQRWLPRPVHPEMDAAVMRAITVCIPTNVFLYCFIHIARYLVFAFGKPGFASCKAMLARPC